MNNNNNNDYLAENFGIDRRISEVASACEAGLAERFLAVDGVCERNQYRVLRAFQRNRVSEQHFSWTTGYGYNDAGRAVTEKVFAELFGAEAALVRPLIVNGTHALSLCYFGILRPGDEVIACTGAPYDTLLNTMGIAEGSEGMGTLAEYGIRYRQIELLADGGIDYAALERAITPKTRMVSLQRATGYSERRAVLISDIEEWAAFVHGLNPEIVCMVDNCYGEFLDTREPTHVGADICAGSLIKNAGGGLALSGGYVCGRRDLVELAAYRMTCPGIGGECGLTFGQTRTMLQGLFLAPQAVKGALKGAMLCAVLFKRLGYHVSPGSDEPRSDIIQSVRLESAEALEAFCKGVQAAAPVDSHVTPEAWDMPGYEDKVIMAAGAFVQGSSIELSADGPMRPPFNVYFQGGLTYEYSKIGVLLAAEKLLERGLLKNECKTI
jgi:cystathionine beta-lyase family protein involved in aluminum resistance